MTSPGKLAGAPGGIAPGGTPPCGGCTGVGVVVTTRPGTDWACDGTEAAPSHNAASVAVCSAIARSATAPCVTARSAAGFMVATPASWHANCAPPERGTLARGLGSQASASRTKRVRASRARLRGTRATTRVNPAGAGAVRTRDGPETRGPIRVGQTAIMGVPSSPVVAGLTPTVFVDRLSLLIATPVATRHPRRHRGVNDTPPATVAFNAAVVVFANAMTSPTQRLRRNNVFAETTWLSTQRRSAVAA